MVQGPHSSGNFNDVCEVIVNAPQSIELNAPPNTLFFKKNLYVIDIYGSTHLATGSDSLESVPEAESSNP